MHVISGHFGGAASVFRASYEGQFDKCTAVMATSSSASSGQIFSVNPYENHPSLTEIEAEVLWEYAKLNQHIKDVRNTLIPFDAV